MQSLFDFDQSPESPELVRTIVEIPKDSVNKIEYDGKLGRRCIVESQERYPGQAARRGRVSSSVGPHSVAP